MPTNDQPPSEVIQIGEVAKRAALTVDAIRFYERRRLLPKAARSAGRFRLYPKDAIERLRFIRQMQGLGFSLREVGELIELRDRKVDACESVRELLKAKRLMCIQSSKNFGSSNRTCRRICASATSN